MRLLLDTCIGSGAVSDMRRAGHDVVWSGEWAGDEELLAMACKERRTTVTLDKDFGELAIVHGTPHWGIVRLVGLRAEEQGLSALAAHSASVVQARLILGAAKRIETRPAVSRPIIRGISSRALPDPDQPP